MWGSRRSGHIIVLPSTMLLYCYRFDSSDQAELHGKAFCIDPVYNVLWTHSLSKQQLVCCYNPIAAGMQGSVCVFV